MVSSSAGIIVRNLILRGNDKSFGNLNEYADIDFGTAKLSIPNTLNAMKQTI